MIKWLYNIFKFLAIISVVISLYCSLYWLYFYIENVFYFANQPFVNHKALIYMFWSVNRFMPAGILFLIVSFLLMLKLKSIDKLLFWVLAGYIFVALILGYGIYSFRSNWSYELIRMYEEIWWLRYLWRF
ncbi:MAG: hypothetical protein PF692_12250 [Kiritimatiellae bacterium]|jgi:hypothetical protein|nr:hypothetical protein [Kiritimatiellia bacterium]